MADLIDRQEAIDAVCMKSCGCKNKNCKNIFDIEKDEYRYCEGCDDVEILKALPTVQPNHNAEVSKMVDDLISRQAAIDAIHCNITVTGRQNAELVAETIGAFADRIKALPPVQPEREQMYKKAFSVACELLIGANLFGVTEETMFKKIMEKDGIVSSLGYEKYILDNLARLTGED